MMGFCLYWRRLTCVVELWFESMELLDSKQEAAARQLAAPGAGLAGDIPNIPLPAELWQVLLEEGR